MHWNTGHSISLFTFHGTYCTDHPQCKAICGVLFAAILVELHFWNYHLIVVILNE